MPDLPSWIDRLPEITRALEAPDAPPFLDRSAIERLFGLRRRQSISLMHRLGGYQIGKTFLVDRDVLLQFLRDPQRRRVADGEADRFRSVGELLAQTQQELHFRRIAIPATPRVFHLELEGLPEGIDLAPGELRIRFQHPQQLLEKLFALSQALANDYEMFEAAWTAANRP
ncbi:MAG: hypothetical protein L0338_31770 [Acidobacteria bacterium]|nr:hypothetical protein [Acidobacteriota bacterium]